MKMGGFGQEEREVLSSLEKFCPEGRGVRLGGREVSTWRRGVDMKRGVRCEEKWFRFVKRKKFRYDVDVKGEMLRSRERGV